MQDELLTKLLHASTEEEKSYLLAMSLVKNQPDGRAALLAAAIVHWFDVDILAALLQADKPEEKEPDFFEQLYVSLQALPFTQTFSERGYALHDLTRAGIRSHLFRNEPERFKAYSLRAAQHFLQVEKG